MVKGEVFHLFLLPEIVFKTVQLIQLAVFLYGEQSEFASCNLMDDTVLFGDWCIELYPGIIVQHIPWGKSNEDTVGEFKKEPKKRLAQRIKLLLF